MDEQNRDINVQAAYLEAFVNCTADGIIAFDKAGLVTSWNGGAELIFGYAEEEAIGQSYTFLGTPEVYAFQHNVFSETMRGDGHQWYDTRRRHKNGDMIDVSITTSPLIVAGRKEGAVAIVRDITEKVRAAEELSRRNAMLDALVQEQQASAERMADLNAQLQAQAEEKQRFVNMVIHDLRHPLTSMRTVLHLLRHDGNLEQHAAYLDTIEGRVNALTNLLYELTEYHRIEAGRPHMLIDPVDVGALIRDCVANFTPALVGGSVSIACTLEPGLGLITTDSSKLTHIVLNLLSNALKFTQQGTVSLVTRCEGDHHWSLTVADTGIGMTPEVQSHVYEEFYQGEMSLRRQDGSGLGLSIAKRLCTALQGDMEMLSAHGHGTRFRLVFPLHLQTNPRER